MKQVYADSIVKAKSYYDGFEDILHDLAHSERVAELAKQIAKAVSYKDTDILELCAFWHDVARARGVEPHEEAGATLARDDLLVRGATNEEANKIYEAIRFHKSTAQPQTIEGKIIRDADKLDIFTVSRWQACADDGWKKEYSNDLKKTVEVMGKYPDAFTYDFSKDLYEKRLPGFLAFWESVKDQLPKD